MCTSQDQSDNISLPEFPADARAARGFNGDIALHAGRWRAAFAEGADHVGLGRRVARKSLLAVAGLVSVQDGAWTTDRLAGARRWAEIEPDRGEDLDMLVSGADGEVSPNRDEVWRRHLMTWSTTSSPGSGSGDEFRAGARSD